MKRTWEAAHLWREQAQAARAMADATRVMADAAAAVADALEQMAPPEEEAPFIPQRTAEPWLKKRQAASHIGVSTRLVEMRQVSDGLPMHRVHGLCLYRASELDAWLAERDAA